MPELLEKIGLLDLAFLLALLRAQLSEIGILTPQPEITTKRQALRLGLFAEI
jgi:hypothetical protein